MSDDSDAQDATESEEPSPESGNGEARAGAWAARLPKIDFPPIDLSESTIQNLTATKRMADQFASIAAKNLAPALQQLAAYQQTVEVDLQRLAQRIASTIDLDALAAAAKIAEQFAAQQARWLAELAPAIEAIRRASYPPNLRGIEELEFDSVRVVVMEDGIPLYGVPRAEIAEALVRAETDRERRGILDLGRNDISADCRAAVESCTATDVVRYSRFAISALDAFDAGHYDAAQALAGSLIDTIVLAYFGDERTQYTPHPQGKRTQEAYDDFTIRQFTAFAPIWRTYQHFFAVNGDPIPTTFSRHATAHAVHESQFTRDNAIQGIMFACSLMYWLEEEAMDT
ncbi:hypothetical protein [Micrococcus terreus]|uniref:hypothetical protein n=1 Tax=Micrococcus terreus TaxID=574650 RepID=UPI0023F75E93|nr:hypothetical protein [Micrococcus terreus]